jgi:hypothetical protein
MDFSNPTWFWLFGAIGALGFPFVVINAIYAALAYHRQQSAITMPPKTTFGNDPGIFNIPRKVYILSLISSLFLMMLLYSARSLSSISGPPGPQGAQGPQGIMGLPGTPGRVDPAISQQVATIEQRLGPSPSDITSHIATAYWYRNHLNILKDLIIAWNGATQAELNNLRSNRGPTPYAENGTNISDIEPKIKGVIHDDLGIDLNLNIHPQFDLNRYYPAPNVDQIVKDYDKEEYRRLSDQYAYSKNILNVITSVYENQIAVQEDYVKRSIVKPQCSYQSGGLTCR